MLLFYGQRFLKQLSRFRSKDALLKLVQLKLNYLATDPHHPSLRLHKLSGKARSSYSISINSLIRVIAYLRKDGWHLFSIGTHDQVYRDN